MEVCHEFIETAIADSKQVAEFTQTVQHVASMAEGYYKGLTTDGGELPSNKLSVIINFVQQLFPDANVVVGEGCGYCLSTTMSSYCYLHKPHVAYLELLDENGSLYQIKGVKASHQKNVFYRMLQKLFLSWARPNDNYDDHVSSYHQKTYKDITPSKVFLFGIDMQLLQKYGENKQIQKIYHRSIPN